MILYQFNFPIYGMMIFISLIMGAWFLGLFLKKNQENVREIFLFLTMYFCYALFGGAMLCYMENHTFGLSSYGGAIGVLLAAIVFEKIKPSQGIFMKSVVLALPLIYAISKLGCFFAGCCYGKETTSACGITFLHSDFAPNGVKLIPTQLIMSGANLLHMAVLLVIARFAKKRGLVSGLYICFYSIGRFLIEYLRNDDRGAVGALSTSQFYSIITLAAGLAYLAFNLTRKEKETQEEIHEEV